MTRTKSFWLYGLVILGLLMPAACAQPPATQGEAGVRVLLQTEMGNITIEVYPSRAPISAGDFLRYVDGGWYNKGAGFYRVVRPDNDKGSPAISVVQGGLPDDSKGLPLVAHETTRQTGLLHVDGAVSLARGEPGTGSARYFFISIGEQPSLDFGGKRNPDGQGFAVFGRVIEGMDVVRGINALKADKPVNEPYVKDQMLRKPVMIRSAKRLVSARQIPQVHNTL